MAPHRVPVEHRFGGLDRRTFKFAIPVILLAVLWSFVVPAINRAVEYDNPARPGDLLAIGAGVTLVPPAGWNIQSGQRTTETTRSGAGAGPITLVKGGLTFNVTPTPWTGDSQSLLTQLNKSDAALQRKQGYKLTSERASFTTDQGVPGLIETFATTHNDGIRAAVVMRGLGLSVVATGPPTELTTNVNELRTMIKSIGVRD